MTVTQKRSAWLWVPEKSGRLVTVSHPEPSAFLLRRKGTQTMPTIRYVERKFSPRSLEWIARANTIIAEYIAQRYKLTLRQLYYQFVSREFIPNTIQSYKNLGGVVSDARLAGMIDWDAIEDRTRNLRSLNFCGNPQELLSACAEQYRTDRWEGQPHYCEVWVEKEALIGVLEGVCNELRIPYFACRGYVSQSEIWSAAQRLITIESDARETHVMHLGDHDPSGIDMSRDSADRLRLFGPGVSVERIALNMDQIQEYGPPPNPAKLTDARYAGYKARFGDESWELDALEPAVTVALIREAVEKLIDPTPWEQAKKKEARGQRQLAEIAGRWGKVAGK